MGDFRSHGRGGFGGRSGGRGFGGRGGGRDSGRFERRSTEMFDTVCAKCGKNCQVPFKPSGDKPVYCSDCFKQNEGGNSRGGSGGVSSEQLNQINAKLDKILAIMSQLELDDGFEEDEEMGEENEGDADDEDIR